MKDSFFSVGATDIIFGEANGVGSFGFNIEPESHESNIPMNLFYAFCIAFQN